MAGTDDLKELLAVYNSITPSRRRWIRNRVTLRNQWKELFQALEKASGRTGTKIDLYDENWHEISDKGGVNGPVNKSVDDIDLDSFNVDQAIEDHEANKQNSLEAEGKTVKSEGDKLRDMSVKTTKEAEAQKDIETTPSHVAALGEEPKTKAENKSDIEGDPSTTETDGDGVRESKVKADDRLPQERLADAETDKTPSTNPEDYDTKGVKNGSAEQSYPVGVRPEVNTEEGDAPEDSVDVAKAKPVEARSEADKQALNDAGEAEDVDQSDPAEGDEGSDNDNGDDSGESTGSPADDSDESNDNEKTGSDEGDKTTSDETAGDDLDSKNFVELKDIAKAENVLVDGLNSKDQLREAIRAKRAKTDGDKADDAPQE